MAGVQERTSRAGVSPLCWQPYVCTSAHAKLSSTSSPCGSPKRPASSAVACGSSPFPPTAHVLLHRSLLEPQPAHCPQTGTHI